ncbi:hypothetical protein ACQPXH_24365 [Nocardia sp. CA-135953]|uniref:hypothetical protein n=1 Tax=Nocardia sp. CA-135953 TaxID=3239978 RepID=UPI003D96B7A8
MGSVRPDGYYKDRDNIDNNTRGRIFENGAESFFRDRDNGYVQQSRGYETDSGRTEFDKIRERDGETHTIEEKSGRVDSKKDVKQLEVVRDILGEDENHNHILRTVEGEFISKDVQVLIRELEERFPDQFTHQIIARDDAREIWARGLEREPAPQLELPGVGEQARLQKQRQRDARQLEKERQERERAEKPTQSRAVEREPADAHARENDPGKAKPPTVARERIDPAPKAREVREREEAQAREVVDSVGGYLSDARKDQVLAARRDERDNERKGVVLEIKPTRGHEPPAPPPPPQRTPEHERDDALARAIQERDNARALAKENGLSPQMMGILGLNSSDPPKMIDAAQARAHAESERDRSIHQQRERERAEREREGRVRGEQ